MNKIIERIYVGSWSDALCLNQSNLRQISAVLNVCEELDSFTDIAYMHMPFPDHLSIPEEKFCLCMAWLGQQYGKGNNILIHCALGVSRSPTICAAFLAKQRIAKDIDEGLSIVRSARPQVNPAPLTFLSAKEYLNKCL